MAAATAADARGLPRTCPDDAVDERRDVHFGHHALDTALCHFLVYAVVLRVGIRSDGSTTDKQVGQRPMVTLRKLPELPVGGCTMKDSEPSVPQRHRFALFLLSAYRELKGVYPGGFESFLVATCASMGNRHDGKAVNISSIAEMTGIPRPTVIRKLNLLENMGLVRRTETARGTMVYMSQESWERVRPHVARLLELEMELAASARE